MIPSATLAAIIFFSFLSGLISGFFVSLALFAHFEKRSIRSDNPDPDERKAA